MADLRARALRLLARREHSRDELEQKLLRAGAAAGGSAETLRPQVRQVLDELSRRGLQSDGRTAEALVHAKAPRWGARRLQVEMQRRGMTPEVIGAALEPLHGSEVERARALWSRRFGRPASDLAERARQARYLAGRGFSSDVIRQVVAGGSDDD